MAERIRTNAEIDLLNQFLKEGETPLPYETAPNSEVEITPLTLEQQEAQDKLVLAEKQKKEEEEKEAAKKQKEIDDAAEIEKQKIIAQNTPAPKVELTPAPIVEAELDDEKVLAYLKNKKGKEVTSLDEFLNPKTTLTAEEIQAAAEKRDANKFAYGLQKGIFTKKQLEEFITDTKNPQDLVFSLYAKEQKEKDDELSDKDIEEEFNEKFGLNQDEESRQYKAGQNLLNNIADNIIRKKHEKILNLEKDFSSYESAQSQQQSQEQKVLAQAPLYKKDVEDVRNEIKKVSIPISNTETFEVDVDDEIVNDIISNMLDNKYAESHIANGWDKENLRQGATISAIMKSLPKIITKYADAQVLAKQAGVRGIIPQHEKGQRQQEGELTERQKQALAFAFPNETAVAN